MAAFRIDVSQRTYYENSPAADDAFPQLLTSLSMAKEKYYQPPGVLAYRCN